MLAKALLKLISIMAVASVHQSMKKVTSDQKSDGLNGMISLVITLISFH